MNYRNSPLRILCWAVEDALRLSTIETFPQVVVERNKHWCRRQNTVGITLTVAQKLPRSSIKDYVREITSRMRIIGCVGNYNRREIVIWIRADLRQAGAKLSPPPYHSDLFRIVRARMFPTDNGKYDLILEFCPVHISLKRSVDILGQPVNALGQPVDIPGNVYSETLQSYFHQALYSHNRLDIETFLKYQILPRSWILSQVRKWQLTIHTPGQRRSWSRIYTTIFPDYPRYLAITGLAEHLLREIITLINFLVIEGSIGDTVRITQTKNTGLILDDEW